MTGLYPESHGIVGNNFYDPLFNETFSIKRSGNTKWWQGEPIWSVAARASVSAGCAFWPGSDVVKPPSLHYMAYNRDTPLNERVDRLLDFIDQGDRLLTLYFEGVDGAGHRYGTAGVDAELSLQEEIDRVDTALTRLLDGLRRRTLDPHILLVSDHGVASRRLSARRARLAHRAVCLARR